MKKRDLAALALMGLASGLLVACQPQASKKNDTESSNGNERSNGRGRSRMEQTSMTREQRNFNDKLDAEGQRKFQQMNHSQRQKAMDMTKHDCKGKNSCRGRGGCSTDDNDCAGMNSCKGQGGCATKDANEAVDSQHKAAQKQGASRRSSRNSTRRPS